MRLSEMLLEDHMLSMRILAGEKSQMLACLSTNKSIVGNLCSGATSCRQCSVALNSLMDN